MFRWLIAVSLVMATAGVVALSQGIQQMLPVPMPNAFLANPNAPNIIQNGGMQVDQQNEGAAVTVTSGGGSFRIVDRMNSTFAASTSNAGDPTAGRQAVSSGITGFVNSIIVTANATPSTSTPAALRLFVRQTIEAADVWDLGFGATGAQPVTVSIWLKTSLTNANFGVSVRNNNGTRTYPHICNVPVAATWTKCNFTAPGDTTGTWLTAPGSSGMLFTISLAAGSTFQGTADTWQAANVDTTSAQTQFTDTAGATLEMTGVKIERGPSATAFVSTPYAALISQLQRYYRKSFTAGTAPAQSAGVAGATCIVNPIAVGSPGAVIAFNPPMVASPTVVTYNPSAANANWRDVTAGSDVGVNANIGSALSTTGVGIGLSNATTVAGLQDVLCIHYTASTAF